jgi:hypothetical protein
MAVDPILLDLQFVMETGQELDILNFYKSFPITCRARVEKIENNQITLHVQPPGSVCLEEQEQTIILSRGLPEAVRAHVVNFDLVKGELVLSELGYVGSRFGDRMIARVQPENPLQIEIEVGDQQINGELVDVSLSGVGVHVKAPGFQRSQLIHVTLPLPEGRVTLPGKILNVVETEGKYRLSIGFTRNAQEIAIIMRYIKDRRAEILAEIERMYQRSYHDHTGQPG